MSSFSCAVDSSTASPVFERSFDTDEGSFAPNHYEQVHSAQGSLRVGERVIPVSGHGHRDHSWGPRYWQTPWFYRWIHGSCADFGFMGAWFGRPDGSSIQGGFVWNGRQLRELDRLEISSERDDRDEQTYIDAVLHSQGHEWKARGTIRSNVPLRNRRADDRGEVQVTKIVEGLTRWTLSDGRVLHGMSEYLDQIIDGRPVGLAV